MCSPILVNYTDKEYQAHRQNWSILQSPKNGFMYFANNKGLLEFNGSQWSVYVLPNKKTIRSLWADKSGKVFTGALGEFGYWQKAKNEPIKYFSLTPLIKDSKAFQQEEIWNIIETPEGIVFQSFAYMFLFDGKKIETIKTPGNILYLFKANNRFYINVIDKGLFEYAKGKFIPLTKGEFLAHENVNSILPYGDGNSILIGTQNAVYLYKNEAFSKFNSKLNGYLAKNQLNKALKLQNGNYIFGTIQNGVIQTDAQGNTLNAFNKNNKLINNTVLALAEDRQGNIWAGLDNGIALLALSSAFKTFDEPNGQLGTVFDAELFNSAMYLATNQGVFYKSILNPNSNFKIVPHTEGYSLNLFKVGSNLYCGHNFGTFKITPNQGVLISNNNGGTEIKKVENSNGKYIQGTYTHLIVYDSLSQLNFKHRIDTFFGPIIQVESVGNHKFIIHTLNQGLQLIALSNDLTKVIKRQLLAQNLEISSIVKIGNQLLICTNQGVKSYNNFTEKLETSPALQKLGTDIKKIFNLKKAGIIYLKNDLTIARNTNGRWSEIPINTASWLMDNENLLELGDEIMIAKENGFDLSSIQNFNAAKAIGNPFVSLITTIGQNPKRSIFYDASTREPTEFSYNENNLAFWFAIPKFAHKNHFRYKLSPVSTAWVSLNDASKIELLNLEAGNYELHLKSDAGTGETIYKFTINKPWFWNFYSITAYLILIVGGFRFLYLQHLRTLNAQNQELILEKEKELKLQEEKNQQELVKLRNQQLEEDVIKKTEELADSTIQLIKRNEVLKALKQEVEKLDGTQSNSNLTRLIDTNLKSTQDWHIFNKNFNKIHEDFFKRLLDLHPNLSQGDLKLCAFLKMNLSSKEIGQLLNITYRSVELKRHRLRQKLGLSQDVNITVWLVSI